MTDIHVKYALNFSYMIYPNPSDEFINIAYSLDTEMVLTIEPPLITPIFEKSKKIASEKF